MRSRKNLRLPASEHDLKTEAMRTCKFLFIHDGREAEHGLSAYGALGVISTSTFPVLSKLILYLPGFAKTVGTATFP